MANAFRLDVDGIAQYLRYRVNNWISPYHAGHYPVNCRSEVLSNYEADPLLSHPSVNGSISLDQTATANRLRSDVINLAAYYANIVLGRYGVVDGNSVSGGGSAYFYLKDDAPIWDPTNSNEVNSFFVGTDQGFYGYSDGGGLDDGVSGTRGKCGLLDGVNNVDQTNLSYWKTNYLGTNGDNVLYLRLRGAGGTPMNWIVTIYDENGGLIFGGRLAQRDGNDAFYVPGNLSLIPYVGRTLYIRIRSTVPPIVSAFNKIQNHRAQVLSELNALGSVSGNLSLSSISSLYDAAWSIINNRKDDVTVDLTIYGDPTLPGTSKLTVGTGNGFTGFSDGGHFDINVAGSNAKCGSIDGVNIDGTTKIGSLVTYYLGSNDTGYLYVRFPGAGDRASDWTLFLYDEQFQVIKSGQLGSYESDGAWYLPAPFSLTPYLNRTIYVKVLFSPPLEPS